MKISTTIAAVLALGNGATYKPKRRYVGKEYDPEAITAAEEKRRRKAEILRALQEKQQSKSEVRDV